MDRKERSELSQVKAVELLGIGERRFRRWRVRHCEQVMAGLLDGRLRTAAPGAVVGARAYARAVLRTVRGNVARGAVLPVCGSLTRDDPSAVGVKRLPCCPENVGSRLLPLLQFGDS